jgi:hypothetical protein
MNGRLLSALCLFWIVTTQAAECCTIPVFRFALDRWEPDRFKLVVPANVAAKPEIVDLLRPLRAGGKANLDITTDRSGKATRAELFSPQDGTRPVWAGELNAASLAALLDSPGRAAVMKHILEGDSVTWVIVDGGTPADDAEVERITKRLNFLKMAAALPIQDPNDPDSQLGPGPELKLEFRVMRLRLDDQAEKPLIAMLAGVQGRVDATKPFAAAVFGRGRVLGAWQMSQLDDTGLEDACMFLIGRCSCRVKNENPGWDLLMNVDWVKTLEQTAAERKSAVKPAIGERKLQVPETAQVAAEAPKTIGSTSWMLWGGFALLGVALLILLRK